jgi:hypothetical protein
MAVGSGNNGGSNCGIIYFNVGTKCLVRLAVSLFNLRKHWSGPICVLNGGLDHGIAGRICGDPRISAECRVADIIHRRKNTAYAAKPTIMRQTPFDVTVFLDADTLPVGSVEPLLDAVARPPSPGILLTTFSGWVTTGSIIKKRVQSIARTSEEAARLGAIALSKPMPAVNTGVIAFRRGSPFLIHWQNITEAGWNVFIADEMAAQVMTADPEKYPCLLVDDRWNASPMYHSCPLEDVVVWHFHGDKHVVRPDGGKGRAGHVLWWPAFQEVWAEDVGGIQSWGRDGAGDKALMWHLQKMGVSGEGDAT